MAGILFVISAPSGTGKTTIAKAVQARMDGLEWSVSFTTRPPRQNELDGREYHFVESETFDQMVAAGDFLENAFVFGNRYGTGMRQTLDRLASGDDLLVEIDVQGAAQIRASEVEAVLVMILPPDFATLEGRLIGRDSETTEQQRGRLAMARVEAEAYDTFDYVVMNRDVESAVAEVASIVTAERRRVRRCRDEAEAVLESFPK